MREEIVKGSNPPKRNINFEYYKKQNDYDKDFEKSFVDYYVSTKKLIKEEARREVFEEADDIIKNRINELERDCSEMRIKLENSIPMDMIVLFGLTVAGLVFVMTTTVFQIVADVKIIDYYLLFFGLFMSVGLLCTSVFTIIYWKRFLNNVQER